MERFWIVQDESNEWNQATCGSRSLQFTVHYSPFSFGTDSGSSARAMATEGLTEGVKWWSAGQRSVKKPEMGQTNLIKSFIIKHLILKTNPKRT